YAEAARTLLVTTMDPALVNRAELAAALDLAYELGVADATETAPELALEVPERRTLGPLDITTPVDEQAGRAATQLTAEAVLDDGVHAAQAAPRTAPQAPSTSPPPSTSRPAGPPSSSPPRPCSTTGSTPSKPRYAPPTRQSPGCAPPSPTRSPPPPPTVSARSPKPLGCASSGLRSA